MGLQRNSIKKIIKNNKLIKPDKIEKEIPKEKLCSMCSIVKLINKFPRPLRRGKRVYSSYCKECCNKKSAEKRKSTEDREDDKKEQDILRDKVLKLSNDGLGSRRISKKLGITRSIVKRFINELELDVSERQNPKKEIPITRVCKMCPENGEQLISNFGSFKNEKYGYTYYKYICHKCSRILRNERFKRSKNKPEFKLRVRISSMIWEALKLNESSKNNESCLKYLTFSTKILKDHFKKLFSATENLVPPHITYDREDRVWMTWDNWKKYSVKTWDDNDPNTWVWNLDHIIPQSDLPYTNMNDDNFKKCWDLSNLRPLSAKQNIKDGAKRIRHKKK
jgi:hypothetical protein